MGEVFGFPTQLLQEGELRLVFWIGASAFSVPVCGEQAFVPKGVIHALSVLSFREVGLVYQEQASKVCLSWLASALRTVR